MTLEPAAAREFAQYLRYFEVEALVPVMISLAVSLAASGLWLAVVMWYLRPGPRNSTRLARRS
jgi:hypothetical protein